MDSHCPDAARSAPRSSAIRFPSDGDDIGDTAAGGTFLSSSWTSSSFEKLVAMKDVRSDENAVDSLRCEHAVNHDAPEDSLSGRRIELPHTISQ